MPIDQDVVIAAYRYLLKREPESESVISEHAASSRSVADFIQVVAGSEEYRQALNMERISDVYWSSPQHVEVSASEATCARLMARVQRQWRKLGETDPYWSVLTSDKFRMDRINAAAHQEFFESGNGSAGLIEHFEGHAKRKLTRGTCFELGCGVGRVTNWLSKKFDRVIAADISPGNIALCKSMLKSQGVSNVEFLLLEDISAYDKIPDFDVLFSVIVLQHNTPPVQKLILQKLLPKIRPRGGCLFQTPASIPNYSFAVKKYLESPDAVLEMHALPMSVVLDELQGNGLHVLGVTMDNWTGMPGSYTYFAIKNDPQESVAGDFNTSN